MKESILGVLLVSLSALAGDVIKGEAVYQSTCAFCHSIRMTGGMGRDFNLVSYTRTKEQIKHQIRDPHVSAFLLGYSANAMPKFNLTDNEIENVASYIDALQPIKGQLPPSN